MEITQYTAEGFLGTTPDVVLTSGKLLFNMFGKYKPDLAILVPDQESLKGSVRYKFGQPDLNLPVSVTGFFGTYFVSKKGTNCFEMSASTDAPHILLIDDWGGAFCSYRGRELFKLKNLYARRACSNGGGAGYDYVVIERGTRYALSEDDI